MCIPSDISGIKDPVLFLNIFVGRVQTGVLNSKGNPIQKQSVEKYLRSVRQIFAAVGTTDPRINTVGSLDFSLGRQLKYYARQDPPPLEYAPSPLIYYTVSTQPHKVSSLKTLSYVPCKREAPWHS